MVGGWAMNTWEYFITGFVGILLGYLAKGLIDGFIRQADRRDQMHEEARLADDFKRLEILRGILGTVVPFAEQGVVKNWDLPDYTKKEVISKRVEYREMVGKALPYITDKDDADLHFALSFLHTNLYTAGDLNQPASQMWEKLGRPVVTASPAETEASIPFLMNKLTSALLPSIRAEIENKIAELEGIVKS